MCPSLGTSGVCIGFWVNASHMHAGLGDNHSVRTDDTLPPAPSGELAAVFGHGFVSTGGGARDLSRQSPSLASATVDTDLSDPSRRCCAEAGSYECFSK